MLMLNLKNATIGDMAVPRRFRTQVAIHRAATFSRLILECLAEFGEVALSSFFPAKYPEARIWRALLGLDEKYRFGRESFSTLLWRLKTQGLVARSGRKRESRWRITEKGQRFLQKRSPGGQPRSDGIGRLVIFDIPEKQRVKRQALRLELVAAGFHQLQKSVWYGERPLPPEIMELVDALGIRSFVHIFSVREKGTLSKINKINFNNV